MVNPPPYNGDERREQPLPTALVAYMDHLQHTITEAFRASEDRLEAKIDARFDQLEEKYLSAFPKGDPVGHRAAHEAQIKIAQTWSDIWKAVLKKLAEGAAWAAVLGVAYLVKTWWEGHFK